MALPENTPRATVRWYTCPVVEVVNSTRAGGKRRYPKVADLTDPGTGLPYNWTAAISDGQSGQDNDTCLVKVIGVDHSPLDKDPTIERIAISDDAAFKAELVRRGRRYQPGFDPDKMRA